MWYWLFVAAWLGFGCVSAAHAIMYKRDPRSAAIWLFISFVFPIFGPWLYWGFGINRIERRAMKRRRKRARVFGSVGREKAQADAKAVSDGVGHLQPLRQIGDRVTRLPLLPGNKLTPLHNGEQAYPEMLNAISLAQKNVTIESYIFDWDDTGRRFARALGEAAQRGVKVHILLDGVGAVGVVSRIGRMLLKSKAEVAGFFPLGLPLGRLRVNLRNHRKIMVVDGKIGFTGGMNISAKHYLGLNRPDRIEDLHFKVEGPVVSELQEAFVEDWYMATNKALTEDEYFPELEPCGDALCRAIISGPDENLEKIHWIIEGALAAAEHSVQIVTPYFIPTRALTSAMILAALRGVRITLIMPEELDIPLVRYATDAYLWQILEYGIGVYRRPAPFVHTKLMIVDEQWLLLGSANLDRRSFRLNFEFNVEAYDRKLAAEMSAWCAGLTEGLEPVSLEAVDSRSMLRRLRDGAVKLFSPYL